MRRIHTVEALERGDKSWNEAKTRGEEGEEEEEEEEEEEGVTDI